jgi:hypothetical protein
MMEKDIGVITIQETWQRGEWEKVIRGYLVIHRNYENRPECLKQSRRECRGVAIILSPKFKKAYERDGRHPPIAFPREHERYSGRFVGITVSFPNTDSYGKRIKGNLRLFIASIYHPDEAAEYGDFNDELTSLLTSHKGIYRYSRSSNYYSHFSFSYLCSTVAPWERDQDIRSCKGSRTPPSKSVGKTSTPQ